MRLQISREKMKSTLKAIGHCPKIRGGNGRGPTNPQLILWSLLGRDPWIMEFIVRTKKVIPDVPNHYKIDLAMPDCRLAIEIDGMSHSALLAQERDAKKDHALTLLGWRVLRFTNDQVMNSPREVMEKILSFTT